MRIQAQRGLMTQSVAVSIPFGVRYYRAKVFQAIQICLDPASVLFSKTAQIFTRVA
jgi:hypothetical protein